MQIIAVLADMLDGHDVRDAVSAAWSLLGNRMPQAGVANPAIANQPIGRLGARGRDRRGRALALQPRRELRDRRRPSPRRRLHRPLNHDQRSIVSKRTPSAPGSRAFFNGIVRIGEFDGEMDAIERQSEDFTVTIERG